MITVTVPSNGVARRGIQSNASAVSTASGTRLTASIASLSRWNRSSWSAQTNERNSRRSSSRAVSSGCRSQAARTRMCRPDNPNPRLMRKRSRRVFSPALAPTSSKRMGNAVAAAMASAPASSGVARATSLVCGVRSKSEPMRAGRPLGKRRRLSTRHRRRRRRRRMESARRYRAIRRRARSSAARPLAARRWSTTRRAWGRHRRTRAPGHRPDNPGPPTGTSLRRGRDPSHRRLPLRARHSATRGAGNSHG